MARVKIDLTVAAIPAFVGAMVAEHAWQRAHPVEPGTRAGDYQLADTLASLSMGVGSLAAPYVARRLLDPVTPGVGRHGRTLLAIGAATAVLTTSATSYDDACGTAGSRIRRPCRRRSARCRRSWRRSGRHRRPGRTVRRPRSVVSTAGSPSARSRRRR